ncbi:MAG: DUF2961 domain-containing protein [Bacteroidales bacterium]|nr:DUF2961 domain-containing protein [Bacteroidales bacterium]
MKKSILSLLALALALSTTAQPYDVTFTGLLDEMSDPSSHAKWPVNEYVCRQSSSYSRESVTPATAAEDSRFRPESGRDWGKGWFANYDFDNYIREETINGQTEYVMHEDNGPGVILGFWTAYGGYCDGEGGDYIFYIDGAEEPAIKMQNKELVGGTGLVGYPFSYVAPAKSDNLTWLGHNLVLPIPYGKSCKITFRPYNPAMTARTHGHYYQIIYRSYKPGVSVESFDETMMKKYSKQIYACGMKLIGDKSLQTDAVSKAGGSTLAPGAKKTITLKGEKCISSLSVQLGASDISAALTGTILKIRFDGEQTVECPVGNFYGIGSRQLSNCTFYVRTSPDGMMTAYWVMPFAKKAEVTLENRSAADVELKVFQTTSRPCVWEPDRSMHFYAWYNETRNLDGSYKYDYNYVTISGKGRYVADGLTVFTYYPEDSDHDWWGEGDEKIFVDGEDFPSHFGTGTEDYYRYAYCRPQPFSFPSISQPIGDGNKDPGLSVNNRYRLLDDIPFEKSFAFFMEIWHPFYDTMDYAPATFWYAFPGCKFCNTTTQREQGR